MEETWQDGTVHVSLVCCIGGEPPYLMCPKPPLFRGCRVHAKWLSSVSVEIARTFVSPKR